MKTLIWSKEEVRTNFSNCTSVGDLILCLEEQSLRDGELVCEIEINGMKLTKGDEEKFKNSRLEEIESLRIKLNPLDQLLEESFFSAQENIESLKKSAFEVAETLRDADDESAFVELEKMTHLIPHLLELVTEIRSVTLPKVKAALSPEAYQRYCSDWEAIQFSFLTQINEILESFEKKNFNLMADLIEYELSTIFDKWTEKLQWIREISCQTSDRQYFSANPTEGLDDGSRIGSSSEFKDFVA